MTYAGTAWDQEARNMATEAKAAIAAHEEVCAIRWQGAMDTMGEIKKILAWGTAGLITCMLGLISFLATHTIVH